MKFGGLVALFIGMLLILLAMYMLAGCGYDAHDDYWRVSYEDHVQNARLDRLEAATQPEKLR